MRKFVFILLLLITSFVLAQEELSVTLTDNSSAGPNCIPINQPNFFEFPITVTNPSPKSLAVSYEWYNASLGAFVSGGKICDIVAGVGQSSGMPQCKVRIYYVFGGSNGTDDVTFRVIGTDGTNTWSRMKNVTIVHYTGAIEENSIDRISLAGREYSKVSSVLSNCYNADAETLLNNAFLKLSDANSYLMTCSIAKSLESANDALNKIRRANDTINAIPKSQCKPKGAPPVEVPPSTTISTPTTTIETSISSITSILTTIGKTNCFGVTFFLLGALALILLKS